MGGYIDQLLGLIIAAGNNLLFAYHYGPYRYLPLLGCLQGQLVGLVHKILIAAELVGHQAFILMVCMILRAVPCH